MLEFYCRKCFPDDFRIRILVSSHDSEDIYFTSNKDVLRAVEYFSTYKNLYVEWADTKLIMSLRPSHDGTDKYYLKTYENNLKGIVGKVETTIIDYKNLLDKIYLKLDTLIIDRLGLNGRIKC